MIKNLKMNKTLWLLAACLSLIADVVGILGGFFIAVFLFSGIIRHNTAVIPLEVIILSSTEMLYRVMAVSTGEYLSRNRLRSKIVPAVSFSLIFILYLAAALYEVWQIF